MDRVHFAHFVGTGGNSLAATLAASEPGYRIVQLTHGAGHKRGDAAPLSEPGRVLFYGHQLYGLPETIGMEVRYITILRHPWERLISDWFWAHRADPPDDALDGFCRMVEGAEHLEFYIHHIGDPDPMRLPHFDESECSRLPNDVAAARASAALAGRFLAVGIMENFDETLAVFAGALGLRRLSPWQEHRHPRTPNRPAFSDLPASTRNAIERKTAADTALYDDRRAAFERQIVKPAGWARQLGANARP